MAPRSVQLSDAAGKPVATEPFKADASVANLTATTRLLYVDTATPKAEYKFSLGKHRVDILERRLLKSPELFEIPIFYSFSQNGKQDWEAKANTADSSDDQNAVRKPFAVRRIRQP